MPAAWPRSFCILTLRIHCNIRAGHGAGASSSLLGALPTSCSSVVNEGQPCRRCELRHHSLATSIFPSPREDGDFWQGNPHRPGRSGCPAPLHPAGMGEVCGEGKHPCCASTAAPRACSGPPSPAPQIPNPPLRAQKASSAQKQGLSNYSGNNYSWAGQLLSTGLGSWCERHPGAAAGVSAGQAAWGGSGDPLTWILPLQTLSSPVPLC